MDLQENASFRGMKVKVKEETYKLSASTRRGSYLLRKHSKTKMMFFNSVTLWAGVLLAACLWSHATGQIDEAEDCCLTTSNRRIPQKVVTAFSIQTGDGPCRIPATVFVTRKGLKLCAPFPSESSWVSKLIDVIITRSVQTPTNHKGKKPRSD